MELHTLLLCASWLSARLAPGTPKVDIDQINNRTAHGGATNFATWNHAQQSFVPHLSHLDVVEIVITPGNSGSPTTVRLKILDGDKAISTKELMVQPDFSGTLRFDMSAQDLEVTPGSRY